MHLIQPRKPATPLEDLQYIVLGDEKVADVVRHDNLPQYTRTLQNPFPIFLACRSEEEAACFAPLKPFIDKIAKRDLGSGEKIIAALDELSLAESVGRILNAKGKFYPLLHGNKAHEGIYLKWADIFPHLEGQDKPNLQKTQHVFIDAMKTMVLRNGPVRNLRLETEELQGYEISLDNIFQQGAKAKKKAPAPSTTLKKDGSGTQMTEAPVVFPPFPPTTPLAKYTKPIALVPRSVPLFPRSPAVPAAPAPSVSRVANPAPPAIASHRAFCDHQACTHEVITLSSDSDIPSIRNTSPFTRHSRQGNVETPRTRHRRGSPGSDAMSISSDTSGDGNDLPAPPIYLKYRDIDGGVFGTTTIGPGAGGVVVSLGAEVDDFLDSWGFASALIHFIYDAATRNPAPESPDEFAARTTKHLSRAEAFWLWKRMKLPARSTGRRRIYAML